MNSPEDIHFMQHALRLGARGMGRCWPNPSVGCLIVLDNRILGTASTGQFGRPHAETEALAQAGSSSQGATAYVTLEPCAHVGHTPPCAQALINAGIARVVIATTDKDSRVAGKGIAMLKRAQIEVEIGLCEKEAQQAHRGFFKRIEHHLPYTAMKIATSLDGAMADSTGKSQWITSAQSRHHAHNLRARYDAILTGIGTVLADDPLLTCRLPSMEDKTPVRVVLDTHLRLPLDAQLVKTAAFFPTWVITSTTSIDLRASHAHELREQGVTILTHDSPSRITPYNALTMLANEGITRLLIEAGSELSGAFMESRLVDRIYWYRAPILLQGGKEAFASTMVQTLSLAPQFQHQSRIVLYSDTLDVYDAA